MRRGRGLNSSFGGRIATFTPAPVDTRSGGGTIARMTRTLLFATVVSGSLDIVFAIILTLIFGREVDNMLRSVASGPFPNATQWGNAGAALGLLVHFTLMAIMATGYVLAARRFPDMLQSPI